MLRPTDANLEMRILLRQAGLRRVDVPGEGAAADSAVLGRSLDDELPEPPAWLRVAEREDAEA